MAPDMQANSFSHAASASCAPPVTGGITVLSKEALYCKECWEDFVADGSAQRILCPSVAEKQGIQRGWFTYTDLCVLMEQTLWQQALGQFYQHVAKLACILGMVYLTGIAAVLASAAVVHHTVNVKRADPSELVSSRPAMAPFLPLLSSVQHLDSNLEPNGSPCLATENVTMHDEQQDEKTNGVMATALYMWGSVITALSSAPSASIQHSFCPHCSQAGLTCGATNYTAPDDPSTQPAPSGLAAHCTGCMCWGWHLPVSYGCKDWPEPLALQQCPSQAALELGRIKAFMFPS